MAFIVIKRSDANAVRVSDLLAALGTSDSFFAQVEKMHNRMPKMSDTEIETLFGVGSGTGTVGSALRDTVNDLYTYLSDPAEAFGKFRSNLG